MSAGLYTDLRGVEVAHKWTGQETIIMLSRLIISLQTFIFYMY